MKRGVFIACDGNQDGPERWNTYVIDENGSVDMLSPEWTREVKESRQMPMSEIDKDTQKKRTVLRVIPVKIGEKIVTGESQAAALARGIRELQKMIRAEYERMSNRRVAT